MSDSHPSELILAVPGPEQMRSFPKKLVKQAIANGEMRRSQLIWSPEHNDWKELRDLPHLVSSAVQAPPPAPKKPAPQLRVKVAPKQVNSVADSRTQTVVGQPISFPVKGSGSETPRRRERLQFEEDNPNHGRIPYLTIVIILLSSLIVGTFAANYYFVDKPFRENLAARHLEQLPIHAHLVGFYQSSSLLIHILHGPQITKDNLPAILVKVAQATPEKALDNSDFSLVSLTPSWYSEFSISGLFWKKLASMSQAPRNRIIEFLVENMEDRQGNPIYRGERSSSEIDASPSGSVSNDSSGGESGESLSSEQQSAWDRFAGAFVSP